MWRNDWRVIILHIHMLVSGSLSNLQGTWWERSVASGQLCVFVCHSPQDPYPPADWDGIGKVLWRMQSLAAGTDFCAPEMQKQTISVSDWKVNFEIQYKITSKYTYMHMMAIFTSQSSYNWRRDWYSLERSIRKSMSRSMQSGSESVSKLIRVADKPQANDYYRHLTKKTGRPNIWIQAQLKSHPTLSVEHKKQKLLTFHKHCLILIRHCCS